MHLKNFDCIDYGLAAVSHSHVTCAVAETFDPPAALPIDS